MCVCIRRRSEEEVRPHEPVEAEEEAQVDGFVRWDGFMEAVREWKELRWLRCDEIAIPKPKLNKIFLLAGLENPMDQSTDGLGWGCIWPHHQSVSQSSLVHPFMKYTTPKSNSQKPQNPTCSSIHTALQHNISR